jgi:hypothetical protein
MDASTVLTIVMASLFVFVRGWPMPDAVEWARRALPRATVVFDSDEGGGREGRAVIIQGPAHTVALDEDAVWTEVAIHGPEQDRPWASERALAHAIHGYAGCETRWWATEEEGYNPYGETCWVLDAHGERTIVWMD